MTEKRFNLVGSYLYDGDECISHFDDPKHRDEIVELLNDFYNENEHLKAQLYYDGDSVCNICKHQYLVKTEKYYVAKCEKGHEECSKDDIKYCEDFKFKELEE